MIQDPDLTSDPRSGRIGARWAAACLVYDLQRDFRLPQGCGREAADETGGVRRGDIEVKGPGLFLKNYVALWNVEAHRRVRGSSLVSLLLRDR